MVFTREKMIRPIRIANDVFLVWEKRYMQSEAMEVFEFRVKIPAFCSAASQTFKEESFSRRVFLVKKWKTSQKSEWNSFVCFIVDPKKKQTLEGRKNNSARENWNRTRRKFKLYFSLELSFI